MNADKRLTQSAYILIAGCITASMVFAAASFEPDDQPTGYIAQPAVTSFNLATGDEYLFRTDYNLTKWTGNLYKIPVDEWGNVFEEAEDWNGAAYHVDAQHYNTGRIIFTRNDVTGNTVGFRWDQLSDNQKTLIGDSKILDYVRGDRSNEAPDGEDYRARESVLGPMFHSSPVYWDDGADQRVYVGASDGMLHAFDAESGNEVFAYIPSMLIADLDELAADPVGKKYFVDGPIAIRKVTIAGSSKSVLVGALGPGGKGLYALDVTDQNPASEAAVATADMVLWEVSSDSTGYSQLGYTYGQPQVARTNSGQTAVIIGNGYRSSGGEAVLYVIDIANGNLIAAIGTGAGSDASPNGLAGVRTIDTDQDGIVDLAYAGDIDGKLWKFDLSDDDAANWTVTLLYTTDPVQAITTNPAIHKHPKGGYMVNFATGRIFTDADQADTATHYAYGIWDGAPVANTGLLAQTLTETSYTLGTDTVRVRIASDHQPNWDSGGHRGWRTPLPVAGERVVGEGVFWDSDRFYFASYNPTVDNPEPLQNGEVWLNELHYLTGGSSAFPFFDINGDVKLDANDRLKDENGDPIPGADGIPVSKFIKAGVLTSQPMLVLLKILSTTLFTLNPDVKLPEDPEVDRGVAGGHFDVDIYYRSAATGGGKGGKDKDKDKDKGSAYSKQEHFHEYDDIYDVTGVNMLNASSTKLNLENAIPDPDTQFKVLVFNQYLNPAVTLSVGGNAHESVKTYGGLASGTGNATDITALLANQPVYTRQNVQTLEFNIPVDGFSVKNWWGDGDKRVGLIPTQTGCVNKSSKDDPNVIGDLGPQGEPFNGALAVHIIKHDTPASAVELNVQAKPEYGYRVKTADRPDYVLAEYTVFWHHTITKTCYGDAGWTKAPPPDDTPSDPNHYKEPAPGSDDPKIGSFRATGDVVSVETTQTDNVTVTITTYSDGTTMTVTTTENDNGTTTIETRVENGDDVEYEETVILPPHESSTGQGGQQTSSTLGRISWREL